MILSPRAQQARADAQQWAAGVLEHYADTAPTTAERKRLTRLATQLVAGRAEDHCVLCGFPSTGPLCIGHSDLAGEVSIPRTAAVPAPREAGTQTADGAGRRGTSAATSDQVPAR